MKNYIILLSFFLWIISPSRAQQKSSLNKTEYFIMPAGVSEEQYLPHTIIFKIKEEYRNLCNGNEIIIPELNNFFEYVKVKKVEKKFPHSPAPLAKNAAFGTNYIDISLIYELSYENDIPLEKAINNLIATGIVRYAVPHFIPYLLFSPDDSRISSQYALRNVMAFAGWDICKGDTNVVIGISDTGTDLTHPDLKDNVKYNYDDPIDGVDNDNDGYLDNFYGWNFGSNDNNSQAVQCYKNGKDNGGLHGIHVSGIAAATTNNNMGIAGGGYKCKFLPVKIASPTGDLVYAYESIIYAADHGCNIINCSWGDTLYSGDYGQDIINYATFNRNVLVVAAAGNVKNNSSAPWYPASYNYVLSVAGTDSMDVKWDESSYGRFVDVSAPSNYILSTWQNNSYIFSGGTSMAAPLVSGLAAIVKSYFPKLNAIQVSEQLKVTSDNIDTIFKNKPYAQQLGAGRVNLYRALTVTDIPSVNLLTDRLPLKDYKKLTSGDTLKISGDFINYLAPTSNLKVTLTSNSSDIMILQPEIYLGKLNTLEIKNNKTNPFKILIFPTIQPNSQVHFKLIYKDDHYSAYQNFSVTFNSNYIDIDTNLIATSLTGLGNIGYNDIYFSDGIGFTYKSGRSLLSCGGLIISASGKRIVDNIFGANHGLDRDFHTLVHPTRTIPAVVSDFDVHTVFDDSNAADTNRLNVSVNWNTYAWNTPKDNKYIICEYVIKNDSTEAISDLYAGLYFDWDIGSNYNNRAAFDNQLRLGYVYPVGGNPYAGIKLLSSVPYHYYAIDNDGSGGDVKIYDGFSKDEKYLAMTTDRSVAGGMTGSDVSHLFSVGPFSIASHDSVQFAFAILAGDNLSDLQTSAHAAMKRYANDSTEYVNELNAKNIFMSKNYPNPFNSNTSIDVYLPTSTAMDLSIFNLLGEKILTLADQTFNAGQYTFTIHKNELVPGIYFYRLTTQNGTFTGKMIRN